MASIAISVSWVALLGLVALAGCTAPAASRDDAGAPPTVSTADVDLHASTVTVAMPTGLASALVILNVTADMWLQQEGAAGRWMLCVDIQSTGLDYPTSAFQPILFWKDGKQLVRAADIPTAPRDDSSGLTCNGGLLGLSPGTARPIDPTTIVADTPRSGSLAVVVAGFVPTESGGQPDETPLPPYSVEIGIGSEWCNPPPDLSVCTPANTLDAEPVLRGANALHLLYWSPAPCPDCVQVIDNRTDTAGIRAGSITVTRELSGNGIAVFAVAAASISPNPPEVQQGHAGTVEFQGRFDSEETHIAATCRDVSANTWIDILASHAGIARVQLVADVTGSPPLLLEGKEIPLDLASVGLHIASVIEPADVPHGFFDTPTVECQS